MSDPIVLSQLRHAYEQLVNGHVRDQRAFADGMIAPLIRRLEADPTTDEALVERVARVIAKMFNEEEHWDLFRDEALAAIRAMEQTPKVEEKP